MVCRIWGTAPACGSLMRPAFSKTANTRRGRPPVQRHGGHGRAVPDRRVAARCQLTGPCAGGSGAVSAQRLDRRGGTLPAGGDSERATVGHQAAVGAADAGLRGWRASHMGHRRPRGRDHRPWRPWLEAHRRPMSWRSRARKMGAGAQRRVNTLLASWPVEGWTRLRAGDGRKARGGMTGAGDPSPIRWTPPGATGGWSGGVSVSPPR